MHDITFENSREPGIEAREMRSRCYLLPPSLCTVHTVPQIRLLDLARCLKAVNQPCPQKYLITSGEACNLGWMIQ